MLKQSQKSQGVIERELKKQNINLKEQFTKLMNDSFTQDSQSNKLAQELIQQLKQLKLDK